MKIQRKIIGIMILVICIVSGCTGCSTFDASAYTQAVLDTNFKNSTEQYIKMTGEEKTAADAIFSDNVDGLFTSFLSGITVSDDVAERGEKVFGNIFKSAKYTVGAATKTENGYYVEVTFNQMLIFKTAITEYTTQIDEYTNRLKEEAAHNGVVPNDQEINDHVVSILLDILQSELDQGLTYGADQILFIHMEKGNDDVYVINNDDYKKVITYAMDSEDVR